MVVNTMASVSADTENIWQGRMIFESIGDSSLLFHIFTCKSINAKRTRPKELQSQIGQFSGLLFSKLKNVHLQIMNN